MRRISLAVLVLALAVPVTAQAQAEDPIVVSARQFAQQGNHDTAIAMLRGALATRPADASLKAALGDMLLLKVNALSRELADLRRELIELRGSPSPVPGTRRLGPASGCTSNTSTTVAGTSPVRVGGQILVPRRVQNAPPIYPPEAQSSKVEGIVILEIMVGCDGSVSDAVVLRGQPLLDDAAVAAVRQWKYTPTLLNGVPVPVIMTVTVTFKLE